MGEHSEQTQPGGQSTGPTTTPTSTLGKVSEFFSISHFRFFLTKFWHQIHVMIVCHTNNTWAQNRLPPNTQSSNTNRGYQVRRELPVQSKNRELKLKV